MDPTVPSDPTNIAPPIDSTPVKPLDPVIPSQIKPSFFDKIIALFMPPFTPQKILAIVLCVIVVLSITGGLFVFGMRAQSKNGTPSQAPVALSSSPTPTDIPTDTPTDAVVPTDTDTPTPTIAVSPTPTVNPMPTSTGTPTPTPTPSTQTQTITSQASLDGYESSDGSGSTTGDIQAGRNNALTMRGFVSFPLNSIPTGVTIDQATIRLYQKSVDGNPYSALGNLVLDHLNYATLDNSDYDNSSEIILSNFATLSSSAATGEWREADVSDRVRDDITNHRSNSQYRLRFSTETVGGGGSGDFAHFEAADTGSNTIPQLFIRYH
ncbi:MAG TPA: DNRLRE domain-containing protein [Patescibacteria group bacterium]|nr:DNRLRE domain-containing protein [Patescibacteria group bacterium]